MRLHGTRNLAAGWFLAAAAAVGLVLLDVVWVLEGPIPRGHLGRCLLGAVVFGAGAAVANIGFGLTIDRAELAGATKRAASWALLASGLALPAGCLVAIPLPPALYLQPFLLLAAAGSLAVLAKGLLVPCRGPACAGDEES